MKLLIKVTKEVLQESHLCGTPGFKLNSTVRPAEKALLMSSNCAITAACRPLFPNCITGTENLRVRIDEENSISIPLPKKAQDFIHKFDTSSPERRLDMDPIKFKIDVPDSVIEAIGIEEVKQVLSQSTTLELVS